MIDIRRMDHFHYDVTPPDNIGGTYNEYELRQLREDLYGAITRINQLLGIDETID